MLTDASNALVFNRGHHFSNQCYEIGMSIYTTDEVIRIQSVRLGKRQGRVFVAAVFSSAWFFAALWFLAAMLLFPSSPVVSGLVVIVGVAYLFYLLEATKSIIRKFNSVYVVECDSKTITFYKRGFRRKEFIVSKIDIDEIVECDFYSYQDSGSLILRSGSGKRMEIPVWCFPEKGAKLFEILRDRGKEVRKIAYGN